MDQLKWNKESNIPFSLSRHFPKKITPLHATIRLHRPANAAGAVVINISQQVVNKSTLPPPEGAARVASKPEQRRSRVTGRQSSLERC